MSILQPRTLDGHLITLPRSVIGRLDLLKVVWRQALSLDKEPHALVLVLPTIEVDASFFHFLFPRSGGRLLRERFRHLLLGTCRVERIAVVNGFELGQQLSSVDMLTLIHEYPGDLAWDLESYVRSFRSLDRTTGSD